MQMTNGKNTVCSMKCVENNIYQQILKVNYDERNI